MWLWGKDKSVFGPGVGSWFHILWIVIAIVVSILLIRFVAIKHDKKKDYIVTWIFAIFFIIVEFLKLFVGYLYNGYFKLGFISFDICSMPIYFTLISVLIRKENKFKNFIDRVNIYFLIIGGLAFLFYPIVLKTPYVLRSLQTMSWHSAMVIYGLYLYHSKQYYKDFSFKPLLKIGITFTACVIVATLINEIGYYCYLVPNHLERLQEINTFFISNHYPTPFPILSSLQWKINFVWLLLLYILGFIAMCAILKYLGNLIYYLINKSKKNKE